MAQGLEPHQADMPPTHILLTLTLSLALTSNHLLPSVSLQNKSVSSAVASIRTAVNCEPTLKHGITCIAAVATSSPLNQPLQEHVRDLYPLCSRPLPSPITPQVLASISIPALKSRAIWIEKGNQVQPVRAKLLVRDIILNE
ncbi:hypothetical protein BGZ63DRAFT_399782 [Mariannaea sp. PMI_226]|nr:hypothetical protein BGZ63DRAFT_399782 [Mariannaea sp. PMI_226]